MTVDAPGSLRHLFRKEVKMQTRPFSGQRDNYLVIIDSVKGGYLLHQGLQTTICKGIIMYFEN